MPIKSNAEPSKRAVLNTTINKTILKDFKAHCKNISFPMNMILESFMEQFTNGEFTLKIARGNKLNVDLKDNKDNE